MARENQNSEGIVVDPKQTLPKRKTSWSTLFLTAIVSLTFVFGGAFPLWIGTKIFIKAWRSLIREILAMPMTNLDVVVKAMQFNSNELESGILSYFDIPIPDEEIPEMDLKPVAILCMTVGIVTEINFAVTISLLIIWTFKKSVRKIFKLEEDDILLESAFVLVFGVTMLLLAWVVAYMHVWIASNLCDTWNPSVSY